MRVQQPHGKHHPPYQYPVPGHGSAALYVKQQGIEGVEDIILDACLHDRSYDQQCEESRAKWLVDLFFNTTHYQTFTQKIITAFQEDDHADDYDTSQLYDLLCELAKRGNQDAYSVVQTWVKNQLAQHTLTSGESFEWLAVEGLEAISEVAENLGFQILNNSNAWIATLGDLLPNNVNEARSILTQKALENPLIQAYLEHDEKETKREAERENNSQFTSQKDRIRSTYSLEQLLADSQKDELSRGQRRNIRMWGKFASSEEHVIIQGHLEKAEHDYEIIHLLTAFDLAELPSLTPQVWELVSSKNLKIREKALTALSNSQHEDVHTFVHKHIKDTGFLFETLELLELFILNFQAGDEQIILNAIKEFKPICDQDSKDKAETLGRILEEIAAEQSSPDVIPLLYWAYENLPCSICRSTSVEKLQELNALTPEMLEECLYDANAGICEIATSDDHSNTSLQAL